MVELNHFTDARLQRDAELLADLGDRLDRVAAAIIAADDQPLPPEVARRIQAVPSDSGEAVP
ncbi:MAG: hypothetical protein ACJ8AI_10630 [Rhodopila sp.]